MKGTRRVAQGIAPAWLVLAVLCATRADAKIDTRAATEGTVFVVSGDKVSPGVLPLGKTRVNANVHGFVSRVAVQQTFNNPYKTPLEVVYVFPLPNKAAVSGMTMRVGTRVIKAHIKTRAQARALYDDAKKAGRRTAVLEQERPNVFTQSVANVAPGEDIHVELVYDVVLDYDRGVYEFVYPMVVGPRYIPGTPLPGPPKGGGSAADTNKVPDASRITPRARRPGSRSGHEVTMSVVFDPGMALQSLTSPTHKIVSAKIPGSLGVRVSLAPGDRIPNRDFVVRYTLATAKPTASVFASRGRAHGHVSLLFEPPKSTSAANIANKELVFIVDTSGSMRGEPLSLAKRAMRYALTNLEQNDTFQILRLRDASPALGAAPLANTPANIRRGLSYVNGLSGDGSSPTMAAVRATLTAPVAAGRLRIAVVMTDGLVGDEEHVLSGVAKHLPADVRLFAFGIGSSVNRYLLDRMARLGRGDVHYALLSEPAEKHVKAFYERIRSPVLTDIKVTWNGLSVIDMVPARIPDVFVGRPIHVVGRYTHSGEGTAIIRGKRGGKVVTFRVPVVLPSEPSDDGTIGRVWARQEIGRLMMRGHRQGAATVRGAVTKVALAYGLVTRHTALVALEQGAKGSAGVHRIYHVPVELPRGISRAGAQDDATAGDGDSEPADESLRRQASPAPGTAAESIVAYGRRARRVGAWRTSFGFGLGAVAAHGAEARRVVLGRANLRVDRSLTSRYAVGAELLATLPELSLDEGIANFMMTLSRTRLLRGLVDVTVGAGGARRDGATGVAVSGNLELRVPHAGSIATGISLRIDSALMPGRDAAGATSTSVGVQLSW